MPRRWMLLFLGAALLGGCLLEPDEPRDLPRRLADRVSPGALMGSVGALSAIHSRYMEWDPGTAATLAWLEETLLELGTSPALDSFAIYRHRYIPTANVEVLLPGRLHPERELIVGAHWDCIAYPQSFADSSARAPGADDNATGVAALIELARLLKDQPLDCSLRLVFFAAEEIRLGGSKRLADRWRNPAPGDSLLCLINVDMIGFDPDAPDAALIYDERTAPLAAEALPLAQRLSTALRLEGLLKTTGNSPASDHLSFWYNGLPAMMLHEGPADALPEANGQADTLGAIDPAYLADCTRALLGAVLALAGPLD